MQDGSVYYGEVAYQSKDNSTTTNTALYLTLSDIPSTKNNAASAATNEEYQAVRHGYGI